MSRLNLASLRGTAASKFLAISLPLVAASTLVVFSIFEYQTYTNAQDQLVVELETLVTTQAEALALPIWNYDTDSIRLTLQAVLANDKVTAIRLQDSNGTIIDEQGDLNSLVAGRLVASRNIRRVDDTGERVTGSLQIALTDVTLRDATIKRSFFAGLTALILVFAVTVATLLAYYRAVGTPLRLLYDAIQAKRNDDKRIVVDWQVDNELGAVISSFNQMQEQQQAYERELEDSHEMLEQRIRERTRELEELQRVAQHATEAKSDFLATMSHEIRTPLNGVVGMTHLLMDTKLDAEQRNLTRVISHSADALLHVINDVLDFSKIEAGKLELERAPFNLRECLEASLDLVSAAAADKQLNLACSIDQAVPETVIGDSARLRQILLNLLSNAVKFTESGEIVVTVQADDLDEHIRFSVSDTGMGIPEAGKDRLFKSFSQVDISTTRKHGGTGLGLAISMHIVELMNGTIWLESQYGQGSTFYFTAELSGTNGASAIAGSHDLYNITGKKVLVVESNVTNQRVLRQQLLAWSMQPVLCNSADVALELIDRDDSVDLCIIDLQLPGASGVELARQIRNKSFGADLPLIFTSTFGKGSEERDDIAALGAIAMLHKPLKHSTLFNALFKGVTGTDDQPGRRKTLFQDARHGEDTAKSHQMAILLVDDNETNRTLGRMLLQRLGYTIDVVDGGTDAINAVGEKNYDLILMDIEMPDMDGFEATRAIRNTHSADQMQIVAMSANALQGIRKRCLDAGMNDYVSKPIDPEKLLKSLLSAYAALQPSEKPADTSAQNAGNVSINRDTIAALLKMIGGATASLHELIASYLKDAPGLFDSMSSGFREDDHDVIRRAAHTLKSSSADFGAELLAELARSLEQKITANDLDGVESDIEIMRTEFTRVAAALEDIGTGSA